VVSHRRVSPYLANSCVTAGTDPGVAWIDTSGTISCLSLAIVPDDSCIYAVKALSLRLAGPFGALIATSTGTWSLVLLMLLSHPLIYRASTEQQAFELVALPPRHGVGLRLERLSSRIMKGLNSRCRR
jgi:hypothetical protein